MGKTGKLVVNLSIDTTNIKNQMDELNDLLSLSLEHCPDNITSSVLSEVSTVLDDIIFTDISPASGAGFNIIHSMRLGDKFERLTAAIRAREFNLIINGHY